MTPSPIVYATDLSGEDGAAFVHAAALAAASQARLVTLHGNAPPERVPHLPDAGLLAARWGRPFEHERRCHECCDDVTDTLLDALRGLAPRLVVLGSHGRHGLRALVRGNVSEELPRNLDVPVLIVPNHGRGFVDEARGTIALERVLIPAGDDEDARRGREAARALVAMAGAGPVDEVVLHVAHTLITRTIITAANDRDAGVIVMTTRGHDGVLDVLFGSHTDHVIRDAPCPVLVVPVRPLTAA